MGRFLKKLKLNHGWDRERDRESDWIKSLLSPHPHRHQHPSLLLALREILAYRTVQRRALGPVVGRTMVCGHIRPWRQKQRPMAQARDLDPELEGQLKRRDLLAKAGY